MSAAARSRFDRGLAAIRTTSTLSLDELVAMDFPRCDLCGVADEHVATIDHPDAPGVDHRRPGPRNQHETCAANLRAHEDAERARTRIELDAAVRRHESTFSRGPASSGDDQHPAAGSSSRAPVPPRVHGNSSDALHASDAAAPTPAAGQHGPHPVLANFAP